MAQYTNPLKHVRVAAPCHADWNRMTGNAQVRFCDSCSQNVYNLSSMTRREAESLIRNTEGRLCVRFYRRADGSIMTRNCPVGLRALKRRVSKIANAVASAVFTFLAGLALGTGFQRTPSTSFTHVQGEMTTGVNETEIPPDAHYPAVTGEISISPPDERGVWTKGEAYIEPVAGRMATSKPRGRR
ncbi:MAG TPA: hypothetical protein VNA19_17655 [Pyrinomonadaceae bacterium]|jgi:hypothetical protein|nr:hypothetical protein [Pyrinomonadaceae bacterium]